MAFLRITWLCVVLAFLGLFASVSHRNTVVIIPQDGFKGYFSQRLVRIASDADVVLTKQSGWMLLFRDGKEFNIEQFVARIDSASKAAEVEVTDSEFGRSGVLARKTLLDSSGELKAKFKRASLLCAEPGGLDPLLLALHGANYLNSGICRLPIVFEKELLSEKFLVEGVARNPDKVGAESFRPLFDLRLLGCAAFLAISATLVLCLHICSCTKGKYAANQLTKLGRS